MFLQNTFLWQHVFSKTPLKVLEVSLTRVLCRVFCVDKFSDSGNRRLWGFGCHSSKCSSWTWLLSPWTVTQCAAIKTSSKHTPPDPGFVHCAKSICGLSTQRLLHGSHFVVQTKIVSWTSGYTWTRDPLPHWRSPEAIWAEIWSKTRDKGGVDFAPQLSQHCFWVSKRNTGTGDATSTDKPDFLDQKAKHCLFGGWVAKKHFFWTRHRYLLLQS